MPDDERLQQTNRAKYCADGQANSASIDTTHVVLAYLVHRQT